MEWFARLYARRIVNINLNIIAAGLLALLPLTLTVHVATTHLGVKDKRAITAITFVADMIFDVAIYYALHWVANHSDMFKRGKAIDQVSRRSFFRDASLVQFERATLGPLLYGLALGLQHVLMHAGWSAEAATVAGFLIGISTTRVIHTLWMLSQERRARRAQEAAARTPPASEHAGRE